MMPRCGWCGSIAERDGDRLVTCLRCGTATTFPPPDDNELDAAYAKFYRPASGRFSAGGDSVLRRSRAALALRVNRRAPAGPVLDVGCGEGILLDALWALDREALGLERESARADVRVDDLEEFDERAGEWAAVILWHSLEHLREASAGLCRACELLMPGGLLVVAVPNRASWQARVLGDRWFALDLPRHLVHLPARALLERVRGCGMRVERVSYWRGGQVVFGSLHGLVALLPGRLDLYAAIRLPDAREDPMSRFRRACALAAAGGLLPLAVVLAAAEVAVRAGGTVLVEARRP